MAGFLYFVLDIVCNHLNFFEKLSAEFTRNLLIGTSLIIMTSQCTHHWSRLTEKLARLSSPRPCLPTVASYVIAVAASVHQDGRTQQKMPPMMEVANFLPIGFVQFAVSPVAPHNIGGSLCRELAGWMNKTLGLLGWFIAAACHPSFIVSCTPEWSATSFSLAMCVMSMPGRSPRASQNI